MVISGHQRASEAFGGSQGLVLNAGRLASAGVVEHAGKRHLERERVEPLLGRDRVEMPLDEQVCELAEGALCKQEGQQLCLYAFHIKLQEEQLGRRQSTRPRRTKAARSTAVTLIDFLEPKRPAIRLLSEDVSELALRKKGT